MAFNVVLQINNSERERVDKTLQNITTLSGTLKSETSIVDPILIIDCDINSITDCNYVTIPSFGRSYFVTNIRTLRNSIQEISCHCDVLSSFKNQLRENSAILRKQQEDWNLYLNDGSFRVYQNPMVLTKAFPSGFTTQEFVLAIAGK